MRNALQLLLATSPGRLEVVRCSRGVFRVLVASLNVANGLVVVGVLQLGSSRIFIHPSMDAAKRSFAKLPLLRP